MSETVNNVDRIEPVKITYTPTNEEYILDFSRESAVFAQERGFSTDEIYTKPTVLIPALFFFSLRKNHRSIAKNQADKLFEKLFPNGMPKAVLQRLIELFDQASLIGILEDEEGKNSETVVEL